jgi:hypothetical protein
MISSFAVVCLFVCLFVCFLFVCLLLSLLLLLVVDGSGGIGGIVDLRHDVLHVLAGAGP